MLFASGSRSEELRHCLLSFYFAEESSRVHRSFAFPCSTVAGKPPLPPSFDLFFNSPVNNICAMWPRRVTVTLRDEESCFYETFFDEEVFAANTIVIKRAVPFFVCVCLSDLLVLFDMLFSLTQ